MAENKGNTETTRRGFLAAIGVGAAALAVPVGAVAATRTGPAAHIPAIREWYQREIERFTDEHEGQFRDGTFGDVRDVRPWEQEAYDGFNRLEDAIRERFGLRVTEREDERGNVWLSGDEATAYCILAVAPAADEVGGEGWHHPSYYASATATEDVLRLVHARGWIERPE